MAVKVGDAIRIEGYGGTWTVTTIVVTKRDRCRMCRRWWYCRRVFALATEGTRVTARECRCEVV